MKASIALFAFVLLACGERSATLERMTVEGDYTRGHELVQELECGRCHLEHLPMSCVGCHRSVIRAADEGQPAVIAESWRSPATLDAWRRNLVNMPAAPSLHAVGKLMRREWIARFLREPHDLRPRLGATMPRLDVSERDAKDIAAYLAQAETEEPYFADEAIADFTKKHPPLERGDRLRGLAIFDDLGCGTCHAFTGARERPVWLVDGRGARSMLLAPDLRFTRERFQPLKIVPWLLEPTHHKIDAVMPDLPLDYGKARDLAAYVMTEPLEPAPDIPVPARLPPLDQRVRFQEVYDKVLSKSCVHCHGDPDFAVDDGGPGFSGGFGFEPIELSFASYEAVLAGYLTGEGERRSVFALDDDGTPHLLAVLLARQREQAGTNVEGVRGMPLGFPALEPWQIQLVESWILQGRPR